MTAEMTIRATERRGGGGGDHGKTYDVFLPWDHSEPLSIKYDHCSERERCQDWYDV